MSLYHITLYTALKLATNLFYRSQHFQKIQKRFPEIVEAIANNTNVAGPVDEGSPVKGDNVLGEASNTTATPKKRGRKPANPPADEGTPVKGDNVLDDVSTTATPKKRGRKPANTPSGDPKTPSKRRKIVKSDKRVHDSDDSAEKESQKKPGADVVDHADEENAS